MKISVIVPTYNSWNTLRECIDSILKQAPRPFEVIVVDNASTDGTFERIQNSKFKNQNYNLKLKIYRNEKNLGVTGGRNRGIKEASKKSDYLFFFDHDMVADKKMLEELVKVAEMDKSIGIVTPKIYYFSNRKKIWSSGTGINLWTGQILFRGGDDAGQYEKIEEVQVAPAAMLVKRQVIRRIKRFDNKYFATFEDTDFCFRAKRAGFKTYYAPKAIAYHKIPEDPKEEAERLLSRAYFVARNRILFMKDFGKPTFWFFLPIYFFYYLRLALKYKRINAIINYLKGSINGILEN
jgi:GT2 family glycosyltransferase